MIRYDDEEARLLYQRTKEAIALAMNSKWEEAATVNKNILESFPNDGDTYNRLGRALMELGDYAQAKEAYRKSLDLAPHNAIAKKNLERLSRLEGQKIPVKAPHRITPQLFVGELGKAGIVELHDVGPEETLAKMSAGDEVFLKPKGHTLIVENSEGEYLGKVETKQGTRLVGLIEGGNKYGAAIARMENSTVRIIIRETYQHPDQVGKLSFPVREVAGFRPYLRDSILRREIAEEVEGESMEGEEEREALAEGFSIFEEDVERGKIIDEE